jgi:hypothetical protein
MSSSSWSRVVLTLKIAAKAAVHARCRMAASRSDERAIADMSGS